MALRPNSNQTLSTAGAARDAAQQDGFLREVDEALRQDEALDMFKRYGKPVGGAVAAGLLVLAGWLWWGEHQQDKAAERAEKFTLALDKVESGGLDAASADLGKIAADGSGGSQAAAKLMQASIAQQQGKTDQAAKLFAAVADDSGAPQPFRDLARIRDIAMRFDSMPVDQVVTALKPLAVPGNAWFGSAGEMLGFAYIKQGHPELAGPLFASIARDKEAPDSLRRRARQLAGQLGVDAIDDVKDALAEGANGPAQ